MPRESVGNRRVKMGAKNKRAEREFEGKLPPFSWFFCCFFMRFVFFAFEKKKTTAMCCHFLLWWCYILKKNDGNVLSFSSSVSLCLLF